MKKNNKPIIIVKHTKKRYDRAAHGSWKIAYADFMTAMMALFLVLALVGTSTPGQLQGVADYFRTPLRSAFTKGDHFSDSESVIPGGGKDVTRVDGEEHNPQDPEDIQHIEYTQQSPDTFKLLDVGKKVVDIIQLDPELKKFASNIVVELTKKGLRIQILSHNKQPMFSIGSAHITPAMKSILHAIAPILNRVPNKITLSGHTDERKYASGEKGYSNWELSGDRANASRRELVKAGLDSDKIIRIIAMADTEGLNRPAIGKDSDRRISILILNEQAKAVLHKEEMVTGLDLIHTASSGKAPIKTPPPPPKSKTSSSPPPSVFSEPPSKPETVIKNKRPIIIDLSSQE